MHEEAHATQKDFFQKVKRPQAILAEMGNPFEEESSELYAKDTKGVVDTQVAENMARLSDTGKKKYSNFMNSLESPSPGWSTKCELSLRIHLRIPLHLTDFRMWFSKA
jgi:hypothetical protein